MTERVKTGIEGLDELLNGGLVKNRHVILSGGPGCGKTTFGYEFLYKGAQEYGEKGLFMSLEQSPQRVVEGAKRIFEFDWDKHLGENILVTRISRTDFDNLTKIVEGFVTEHDVKRVVVDSVTLLKLFFNDEDAYRNYLFDFLDFLGGLDCTSILPYEKSQTTREDNTYDIEEFVADGVINLYFIPRERDRLRVLEIMKMRETEHSSRLVPFKITENGIMINPEAPLFTDMD